MDINKFLKKKKSISPYAYPGIKRSALPAKFNQKQLTISPEEVIAIVARRNYVTVNDILSTSRKSEHVKARHIFCGILRIDYNYSLPFIANFIKRDHTTIIFAVNQYRNRKILENDFRETVEAITFDIKLNTPD
jgi:chromosomal replication initiator protein